MRRSLYFIVLLKLFLCASIVVGQNCPVDVVYLHNGSIIRGELVEIKIDDSVTIETVGGSIFVFEMNEVKKITREKSVQTESPPQIHQAPVVSETTSEQANPVSSEYRNPGTAQILGVVISGGGHFYSGETFTGLALLGISVGAPIAGWTLSEWDNMTPYYIGLGVTGVTWLYSIIDSSNAAQRANRRQGITMHDNFYLSPKVLATKYDQKGYGLSLSINF